MRAALLTPLAVAGLALAGAACDIPATGPAMTPGHDCLSCHDGAIATKWSVAGTLFSAPKSGSAVAGAQVLVTDSAGRRLTLTTNSVGNFYTAEELVYPLDVQVQNGKHHLGMDGKPAHGSCNKCHTDPPPDDGTLGRVFVNP